MNNLTAGTGTPYWYEWSVGLLYVVKMLNPDNQIKNVVLQSDESQSLDDVVITYENGMKDFIQVKHTREDDKVSYSDMIEGDLKKSYLYKYSSEWKEMEKKNTGKNRVIFFTNRKMGNQKYTPKGEWQRPSLSKFWKDIKSQVNNLLDTDDSDNADISKIDVKREWTDAWKAWKDHMGALNEREQLLFMKNFDLITDQEDLDGIIDTIADGLCEVFATTHEKAVTLHQKLCYQLMWWSTSICDKKEIEKEDVMQALSLGGDEVKGEHILPLCEPFFKSRVEFVNSLEKKVLDGKSRVSFLTGNPGCGKTNIISYLACKPDSIVTLRFHAFKPIIPGDLYISADSGISDQKEFWGSLLIMLRELFQGRLYEYRVPVSIELIDSIDKLRAEVMRLSSAWADITGKPRIYLASHLKKAKQLLSEISGSISDFLMGNDFDAKIKHELVFKLLKDAKRECEYVDVFTTEYVIEAYSLKRRPGEIRQQMLSTLESLISVEDKRKIVRFSCAVTTMYQHDESLRWIDMSYRYDIDIPFAMETERKVVTDAILTIDDICNMFDEVELLVQQGNQARAKRLFERWMGMRTPKTLFELLGQKCEKDRIDDVFEIWGKYARMFQIAPQMVEYKSEGEKRSSAQFYRGWLKEAENYKELLQIEYTLSNLSCYYKADLEDYFRFVIKTNQLENIQYVLKKNFRQIFSEYNQLAICAWAIKNGKIDLCEDWVRDIRDKEFAFVPDKWFKRKYTEINKKSERFKIIADIMYVLSYVSEKDFSELRESALEKSGFKDNRNDKCVADNILAAINYVAHIEQCILKGNVDRLNLEDFKVLLNVILEENYYYYCFNIDTTLFRKRILKSIIQLNEMLPQAFVEILKEKLCAKAETYSEVSLFEGYWRYLCAHNKVSLVEKYFDVWMGFNGKIWQEELSDRQYISEVLLKIAEEMRWQERTQKSLELLNVRSIGYVGRKEYSLVNPLNWFERIMNNTSAIWKKEGLLLMNLSEYASKIGDNRAFVQIGGAIAESAAMAGTNDLFQFVNIVQKSKLEWKELLFDGIISMLQTNYFTEEELLIIWEKAAEYFALNEYAERFDSKNTRNKIYCADTHRAISLCAKRLGYNTLEEKMKERAPLEYAQERLDSSMHSCIIPSRWYESEYYANMEDFFDNVEQLSIDEMFSYIEEEFHRGDFSWDYIGYFIQKAKCKDSKYVSKYKPQIMEMLDKKEINSLEYDGCNRLYEVLFPYLTDDEVNNVLNNVVSTYYYHKEKGWASTDYGLMTDLEHFTFALFSRFDLNDNIWALNEILKMHCLWISGTETLGIGEVYQFRENDKTITGWLDMFEKLEYI